MEVDQPDKGQEIEVTPALIQEHLLLLLHASCCNLPSRLIDSKSLGEVVSWYNELYMTEISYFLFLIIT